MRFAVFETAIYPASHPLRGGYANFNAPFVVPTFEDARSHNQLLTNFLTSSCGSRVSHKEIAALRGITEATVRQQARAIYQKAGLPGRAAFSAYFLEDLLPTTNERGTVGRMPEG